MNLAEGDFVSHVRKIDYEKKIASRWKLKASEETKRLVPARFQEFRSV